MSFFDEIFGEGYVYFFCIRDRGTSNEEIKEGKYRWPKHRGRIEQMVEEYSKNGFDVYFNPVTWRTPQRTIPETRVIWADFDGTYNEAIQWNSSVPGEPSIVVQSSNEGNVHAYWKLDKPLTDKDTIERIGKKIAEDYNADPSGWDVKQLLRVPGTYNYKKEPKPVQVKHIRNKTYQAQDFVLAAAKEAPTALFSLMAWETVKGRIPPVAQETIDVLRKGNVDRSSALARLSHECVEGGLDGKETFTVLDYADNACMKYTNRTNRKEILSALVTTALEKHGDRGVDQADSGIPGAPKELAIVEANVVAQEKESKYQKVSSLSDWFNEPDEEQEWIFNELIAPGSIGSIVGDPGVGKTQLAMNIMREAALPDGSILNKFKCCEPHDTLFISLEMGKVRLKKFARKIWNDSSNYTAAITFYAEVSMMDLCTKEGRRLLVSLVQDSQAKGIIIDSLGKLVPKAEEEQIKIMFAALQKITDVLSCYIILIHHNNKQTGDTSDINDIYGSMYIAASLDWAVQLRKDKKEKDIIRVTNLKNRLAEEFHPFSVRRTSDLHFIVQEKESSNDGSGQDRLGRFATAGLPL